MLTVVGREVFTSKKNNVKYNILHCTKEFSSNQIGCEGFAVEPLFFEWKQDIPLGSVVRPIYDKTFRGEARLVDVEVIEQ